MRLPDTWFGGAALNALGEIIPKLYSVGMEETLKCRLYNYACWVLGAVGNWCITYTYNQTKRGYAGKSTKSPFKLCSDFVPTYLAPTDKVHAPQVITSLLDTGSNIPLMMRDLLPKHGTPQLYYDMVTFQAHHASDDCVWSIFRKATTDQEGALSLLLENFKLIHFIPPSYVPTFEKLFSGKFKTPT